MEVYVIHALRLLWGAVLSLFCFLLARRLSRTPWLFAHELEPGPGQQGLHTVRMGQTASVLAEMGALVGRNPAVFTGGASLAAGASKLPALQLFFRPARRDSAGRPLSI